MTSLALTACGDGEDTTASSDETAAAEATVTGAAQAATEEPEQEPPKVTEPAEPGPATVLTGLGATREAWESLHSGVSAEEPIVYYTRTFPEATDLETAKRLLIADFPGGARITAEDDDEPRCLIVLVESDQLRTATGFNGLAAFFSGPDSPLNEEDVWGASMMASDGDEPPDLGFC